MKKPLVALLGSLSLTACCIARGTLVSTPRGLRRIEDLIEQDTLWSVHPETGERVASHLVAIRRATREVMRLVGADFELTCTTDHPLYDPSTKSWASAGDWVLGGRHQLLLVPDAGAARVVTVERRDVSAGVAEVFDLSVEHELHNFVAAGVLVHNKKHPSTPPIQCVVEQDGGARLLTYGEPCTTPDGGSGEADCRHFPDAGTCRPD